MRTASHQGIWYQWDLENKCKYLLQKTEYLYTKYIMNHKLCLYKPNDWQIDHKSNLKLNLAKFSSLQSQIMHMCERESVHYQHRREEARIIPIGERKCAVPTEERGSVHYQHRREEARIIPIGERKCPVPTEERGSVHYQHRREEVCITPIGERKCACSWGSWLSKHPYWVLTSSNGFTASISRSMYTPPYSTSTKYLKYRK